MLLAHASAAGLYQKNYKAAQHGFIGLNVLAYWFVPYTNALEDAIATQRANEFYIGWFVNPLVFGDYPDVVKKNAGTRIPAFTKAESRRLKGSMDFLGVNHYATMHIKDKSSTLDMERRDVMADMAVDMLFTANQDDRWPYQGLKELMEYLKHVYGDPPIYIHENGQPTRSNGSLNDTPRVECMQGFIGSVLDALRNGANARGYFTWSFLDVFEVLEGSTFGLYYVDKDLKRYPKLSAHWYSNFLKGRNMSSHYKIIQQVEKNLISGS